MDFVYLVMEDWDHDLSVKYIFRNEEDAADSADALNGSTYNGQPIGYWNVSYYVRKRSVQ